MSVPPIPLALPDGDTVMAAAENNGAQTTAAAAVAQQALAAGPAAQVALPLPSTIALLNPTAIPVAGPVAAAAHPALPAPKRTASAAGMDEPEEQPLKKQEQSCQEVYDLAMNSLVRRENEQALLHFLAASRKTIDVGQKEKGMIMWGVGCAYLYGVGVDKDLKKAYEHFKLSAKLGLGRGFQYVGLCMELNGANLSRIEFCYKQAADRDCPDAWIDLGRIYEKMGRFMDAKQSYTLAVRKDVKAGAACLAALSLHMGVNPQFDVQVNADLAFDFNPQFEDGPIKRILNEELTKQSPLACVVAAEFYGEVRVLDDGDDYPEMNLRFFVDPKRDNNDIHRAVFHLATKAFHQTLHPIVKANAAAILSVAYNPSMLYDASSDDYFPGGVLDDDGGVIGLQDYEMSLYYYQFALNYRYYLPSRFGQLVDDYPPTDVDGNFIELDQKQIEPKIR